MMAFLSFLGSRLGRYVVAFFMGAAGIGFALLKAFSAGEAKERAKQDHESLKNLRKRVKTDDEVSQMPDAVVRDELSGWVRDDERK